MNRSRVSGGGSSAPEVNKKFLLNTVQSLKSHNRREEEEDCWRQHRFQSEQGQQEARPLRVSDEYPPSRFGILSRGNTSTVADMPNSDARTFWAKEKERAMAPKNNGNIGTISSNVSSDKSRSMKNGVPNFSYININIASSRSAIPALTSTTAVSTSPGSNISTINNNRNSIIANTIKNKNKRKRESLDGADDADSSEKKQRHIKQRYRKRKSRNKDGSNINSSNIADRGLADSEVYKEIEEVKEVEGNQHNEDRHRNELDRRKPKKKSKKRSKKKHSK